MQRIAELVQQVVNMPGTSIENNGQVILAGTIPGTKPVQYRYEFFKPLTDEEIKSVSDSSRRPFPQTACATLQDHKWCKSLWSFYSY